MNSLRVDTAITLPLGVEAYAAYALRAWLTADQSVSMLTRQFARWSAIGSLVLGMAGQVAYHRLAQAGATQAPWDVTTLVSCLPVLVLGMGAALAHMIHADQSSAGTGATEPVYRQARPAPAVPAGDAADQDGHLAVPAGSVPADQEQGAYLRDRSGEPPVDQQRLAEVRVVADHLAASGRRVSRRALRSAGLRGSNAELGSTLVLRRRMTVIPRTAGALSRLLGETAPSLGLWTHRAKRHEGSLSPDGSPRKITDERVEMAITKTLTEKAAGGHALVNRSMAAET